MEKYDLKDQRFRKESFAAPGDLEWIKYGDTYVAGDDSLGNYIDQVFSTLEGKLKRANNRIGTLNKITKHLEKDPPKRGKDRKEWFDDLESLTKKAGISLLDPKDKAAIESDLGVITSPTFSFAFGENWEKQIKDAVKEQENQIKKDNAQTYNWFQKISQDKSIDAVKEALYDMSPEGFVDAIKNSTKGFGEDTREGVKFQNIADPQFAEFVYEQEGTSQLGLEVSQFLGKPPTPSEVSEDAQITVEEEVEQQTGNQNLGTVFAAIDKLDEYQDIADFAGMFGGEASTAGLGTDDTDPPPGPPGPPSSPGPSGPSAADLIAQSKANEDEVYALLQEQFGGASYFFRITHEAIFLLSFLQLYEEHLPRDYLLKNILFLSYLFLFLLKS